MGNDHETPFLFASFFFAAHTNKEKAAGELASLGGLCKKVFQSFKNLLTRENFSCIITKYYCFNREGRETEMAEVKLKEGETLDSALRRFKRQCARSGVLAELRKREHYEKPSVKRKKKSEAARKRKYK